MKSNRMGYPSSQVKALSIFPFEKIATLGRDKMGLPRMV